jgi:hypothetical protein
VRSSSANVRIVDFSSPVMPGKGVHPNGKPEKVQWKRGLSDF